MNVDLILLLMGGIAALLCAGLVLLLSPPRYPTLVGAVALAGLGLLQFGWARAVFDLDASGARWFELTLAFSMSVGISWTLLSRVLGLGPNRGPLGVWRFYIVGQALAAIGVFVGAVIQPRPAYVVTIDGRVGYSLDGLGLGVIGLLVLNIVLTAASFESTYLAYPKHGRRAFFPGILGILLAGGYFTYAGIASLASGHVAIADLGLGAIAVALLSFLLTFSFVRGRVSDARVRRRPRPLTRTVSLTTSVGILVSVAALLWVTRITGWSLARGLWVVLGIGAALLTAALAISNRLQRRVQRLLNWYTHRTVVDDRGLSARVEQAAHSARSRAELCAIIPQNVRDVAGAEPVTLFLAEEDSAKFVPVSTTLPELPPVSVRHDDPLASELRRVGHAIPLRGRSDDLEYIPIYVENAAQISACSATCAAPLMREEELLGFLLCGEAADARGRRNRTLPTLDLACRRYAARLEAFLYPAGRGILSE
ncbi:MAG TPA: hypothetical protein VFP58_15170 [Candidatus Eisenbacteria bacterium]|nr:hypothetical protein [Candidatus Eisenbacteria bacterium]